jgi:CRISPR-associated protein Cas5d
LRQDKTHATHEKEVVLTYGFKVEVLGDYACFSRPELKVERVSYDVITPSAARGILEAVFWKPAIRYVIDSITVCSPIRFENIRRNEVNSKASAGRKFIAAADDRAQRAARVLRNVHYVIDFHFEPALIGEGDCLDDGSFNHGKFADILRRRLSKGQVFHAPYLGTREFPAIIRLLEGDAQKQGYTMPAPIPLSKDLGLMLYDIDYVKDQDGDVVEFCPMFFYAELRDGVIDLRGVEVLR